jgi:hypothetical protein
MADEISTDSSELGNVRIIVVEAIANRRIIVFFTVIVLLKKHSLSQT